MVFAKVDVDDAEVSVETNKYLSELACAKWRTNRRQTRETKATGFKRGKLATGVKRRGKLSAGFERGKLADIASKILTRFKTTNGTCISD